MSDVHAICGQVDVRTELVARAHVDLAALTDIAGGLFPLHAKAFEMDEYRMLAGWPVEIPKHDIRSVTMVSANGYSNTTRPQPAEVATNALIRWVASTESYVVEESAWVPTQSEIGNVVWDIPANNAPVLTHDFEYRVGSERFVRTAINFDSDTKNYLQASFEGKLSGTGYTVVMVFSPNSIYGNNTNVPFNGIWAPRSKNNGAWSQLNIFGGYLELSTEAGAAKTLPVTTATSTNQPYYLAVVFDRPTTTVYLGSGPDFIQSVSVPSGPPAPMYNNVFLGRTLEDLNHTADMALFDLAIYPNRLAASAVQQEFSLLAQTYGGAT